eukprot:m.9560 g.9560  ORF g.9560 m.9560 type:complete len:577 (-) comp5768_c0_seq2:143-1873(-)
MEGREEKFLPADYSSPLSYRFLRFEAAKEGHIVYVIQVTRGVLGEKFEIARRYSDFATLAQSIAFVSGMTLPLPPKKMFGNTDAAFLTKRMQALKHMLDTVASHPILRLTLSFKRFLDPKMYSQNFQEMAEKGLFMFLRSEGSWRVLEQHHCLGWRIQKLFAVVLNEGYTAQDQSSPQMLSWVPIPSTAIIPTDAMGSALKYIAGISHPFISSASLGCVHGSEEPAAIFVRAIAQKGSLRDLIFRAKTPRTHFARKFVGKKPKPLDVRLVRLYGRQILEGLKFLHERGLPFGHLHAGNVLVVNDRLVQISEIENGVLGLPSMYQSYITELKKISSLELQDVYCFGHVLYEMVFGQMLSAPICEFIPPGTMAGNILSQLLTADGVRALPTISQLLQEPFFKDVELGQVERGSFKMSARVKEAMQHAYDNAYKEMRRRQANYDRLRKQRDKEREEKKKHQQRERERSRQVKSKQTSATEFNATVGGIVAPENRVTTLQSAPSTSSMENTPPPPSSTAATPPPPPPAQAPPPPSPPASESVSPPPASSNGRGALLGSIQGFKKGGLKKTETNDRSGPSL